MNAAVATAISTTSGAATVTSGAVGEPGRRVERERAQHEADEPADGQEAVAGHGQLEDEQQDGQTDEDQAGHVERQAAEADEREDQRDRAEDAGHEVRALELEQQAVEAERQQDERDVRIGQQVDDRLERVHAEHRRTRRRSSSSVTGSDRTSTVWPSACLRTSSSDVAMPSTAPTVDRLGRRRRDRLVDGRDGPVDVPAACLGDRPDVGDRVVLDLVADGAGQLLAAGTDR